MPNRTPKNKNLTVKQAKLLKALPTSGSVAEAGEKAGYADRTAAHRALKNLAEKTPEILERLGLGIESDRPVLLVQEK